MQSFDELKSEVRKCFVIIDESAHRTDADGKDLPPDAPKTGDELAGFKFEVECRPLPDEIRDHPDISAAIHEVIEESLSASRQKVNNLRWADGREEIEISPSPLCLIQFPKDLPNDLKEDLIKAFKGKPS